MHNPETGRAPPLTVRKRLRAEAALFSGLRVLAIAFADLIMTRLLLTHFSKIITIHPNAIAIAVPCGQREAQTGNHPFAKGISAMTLERIGF